MGRTAKDGMPKQEEVGIRNEIVLKYLPLVKQIVDKVMLSLPPHVDKDDIRSVAILGLMTAAERFDPSRGASFKTFAERRIHGNIADELREQDPLSRNLRDKQKLVQREIIELEKQLNRKPFDEEIATALNMGVKEYQKLQNKICLSVVSLDEPMDSGDKSFQLLDVVEDRTVANPQNALIQTQMLEKATRVIERLSERHQKVVDLYYNEGLTFKEIGLVFDLTESRIFQLHKEAIAAIRETITD